MVSQQQKAKKAQGNSENGIQAQPATPSARVAQIEVYPDDVKRVKSVEATQNEDKTPTKLSVPDDTVDSMSTNEIEVNERGEILPVTEDTSTSNSAASVKKKRRKKYRELLVDASEVSPRPSIWPLVLAFSIAVALFGLIWNAVILFIGIILIVGSIIGWSLEKRDHTYKSAVPVKKVSTRDTNAPADAMERDVHTGE